MSENKSINEETFESVINDDNNPKEYAFETQKTATAEPQIVRNKPTFISEIGEDSDDIQRKNAAERTPEEIESENWLKMNRDKRNAAVKRSFVTGIKPDKKNNIVYFTTTLYGMTVLIPDTEFFMPDFEFSAGYKLKNEKEKFLERLNVAQYQKGSRLMFIVTSVERNEIPAEIQAEHPEWDSKWTYDIRGSRTRAMQISRYVKFFNPNRDEVNNPLPKVGDVVNANILSVRSDGCRVEALGVESFVSNFELTGTRWVENAQDEVKVGQRLKAKIKKLFIDEKKQTVYMSVSGRLYDTGSTSKNILSMSEGDFYSGVVRSFNPNSRKYTINLENGVPCSVDEHLVVNSVVLNPGDVVSIKVIDVKLEYVVGVAMKV